MLRSIEDILGYRLSNPDGTLGRVKDIYFDDSSWAVRYILLDTGGWLTGRRIVLAPESLGEPDASSREIPVSLTRQRIEESPMIMEGQAVSIPQQQRLAEYYDWSLPSGHRQGTDQPVRRVQQALRPSQVATQSEQAEQIDPHLRPLREMIGYHVRARGTDAGHIEDVVVQTDGWLLRYLVVDARNLEPGKKVLVWPAWVRQIDWNAGTLDVDLSAQSLKDGPAFDPREAISPEYEKKMRDQYGDNRYWE